MTIKIYKLRQGKEDKKKLQSHFWRNEQWEGEENSICILFVKQNDVF